MPYSVQMNRAKPGCFLFLVDQSSSMHEHMCGKADHPRKSEFITDALNRIITTLIIKATKNEPTPRRYYQIGVIGYGQSVGSILGDALGWQELVWVDELNANPLRIEERMQTRSDGAGGVVEVPMKFPVWFEPVANGQTPMCQALGLAYTALGRWVQEHKDSHPPIVMNLTDGEANDGDPRIQAKAIQELATDDGNVLLMTLHLSSNEFSGKILFPHDIAELPDDPSRIMFQMSSPLPQTDLAKMAFRDLIGQGLVPGTRGFVYQAGLGDVINFLDIGTSTAKDDRGIELTP